MTFTLEHDIARSAGFSECGAYRYWLTRQWNPELETLVWIMLNPSTADATQDDPTIRRCMGFARRWGYGGTTVLNLYAYRSTDPKALRSVADPVGPENDETIRGILSGQWLAVAAWGANAERARAHTVAVIASRMRCALMCLGTTAAGAPRHPLYVRADAELLRWDPPKETR